SLIGSDVEMILSSSGANCSIRFGVCAAALLTPPATARPPAPMHSNICRRDRSVRMSSSIVRGPETGGSEIIPQVPVRGNWGSSVVRDSSCGRSQDGVIAEDVRIAVLSNGMSLDHRHGEPVVLSEFPKVIRRMRIAKRVSQDEIAHVRGLDGEAK